MCHVGMATTTRKTASLSITREIPFIHALEAAVLM